MARYRREPSNKQRKHVLLVMNGHKGKEAALQAGYTPALARQPGRLTQSRGFLIAMQQQAESLGYISTAVMAHLQVLIDDGALNELDFAETLKSLEKIANIQDKYANITGWKKKSEDTELTNIIDVELAK